MGEGRNALSYSLNIFLLKSMLNLKLFVVEKSDLQELAMQNGIAQVYFNDITFEELNITREDFNRAVNAYGNKWGSNKYMWGRQESDYYSDKGEYWIDNHPKIKMITTTQQGWKQSDGSWKDKYSATVYCTTGE